MNSSEPNSMPEVIYESVAREILDSSHTIKPESSSESKISESPSLSGAKVVRSHKNTRKKI